MNKHLKIATYPKANEKNLVFFGNFRITILSSCLFRIEEDTERIFCDEATQIVWYRNMPAQCFSVLNDGGGERIVTDLCEIYITTEFKDFRIKINGIWKEISNDGNLGGTYRTLDCCAGDKLVPPSHKKGRISLGNGVCSRTGIAYFEDDSLILSESGLVRERRKQQRDIYVFAFGKDFRGAVNALYLITGKPPMVPRFVFGNWWSRYHEYTDTEYLTVIQRFIDKKIPLTVATVDMDWHYSVHLDEQKKITESGRNTDYYGGNNGWTGYSWNKDLFPDYKIFLKKLKNRGLKVTLNLHPSLGVRWFEDCYEEMACAMGIDSSSGKQISFDITDERFIDGYFNVLHRPYEKDGVDFWWIDWQQGENSKIKGLDPLWALNHYHYLWAKNANGTPLILSRYAGIGSHRYPLGFSGDTTISFETLAYLPYFTATASNIGYTYWSHDIGGHYGFSKNNELYLRFVQFATFNPIMRLHGECNQISTKEPWYFGAEGEIAEEFLRLRHSMIPFFYSRAHETTEKGLAFCEPMYYSYPDDERAYLYKNEYFFCGQLIVVPITSRGKRGYSSVKGYLPRGKWTDIFTGKIYGGDREIEFIRDLKSIPVFAKEGAVIPYSEDDGNNCEYPENLRVEVFDGNGSYELFENEVITSFQIQTDGAERRLIVKSNFYDLKRKMKVVFRNVQIGKIKVYKNGILQRLPKYYGDNLTVVIGDFEFGAEYEIIISGKDESPFERIKENIKTDIMKIEGSYAARLKLYESIKNAVSVEEIMDKIDESGCSIIIKKYLIENIY